MLFVFSFSFTSSLLFENRNVVFRPHNQLKTRCVYIKHDHVNPVAWTCAVSVQMSSDSCAYGKCCSRFVPWFLLEGRAIIKSIAGVAKLVKKVKDSGKKSDCERCTASCSSCLESSELPPLPAAHKRITIDRCPPTHK